MISSNIYNLRRKYIPNGNQEKDQSHSKSKVYTFNENNAYERDFLLEKNHYNQGRGLQSCDELKFTNQIHKEKLQKSNNKKNKENRQSSPSQLNRYLKEYQYNCYKLEENQPSKINVDKIKIQDCFSSDKKLGIKQRERYYDSRQIQSFLKESKESSNILNQSFSNQYSAIEQKYLNGVTFANIPRKLSQQRIHSIPSKTLTFNDPTSEPKPQPLCSKQQLSLIKMLRLQIDNLKQQLQNKNVYISALQTKIQIHLIERIQVENTLEENTISLQHKIHSLELQNHQILEKLAFSQNQLTSWNHFGQKIHFLFSSLQPISSQTVFQLNIIDLEQYLDPILRNLSDFDTYKKLIRKIHQMKEKIDNSANFHSSQQFQPPHNSTHEQICLKNLWKWLKMVGKEYEIMKQRVFAFENPSPIN